MTMPLRGYEVLMQDLSNFVLANRMVPTTTMTVAQRSAGAKYPYEFEAHLDAKLQEHQFPPARLHDLRKALVSGLRKETNWHAADQEYFVNSAFNVLAERHEMRRRQWSK